MKLQKLILYTLSILLINLVYCSPVFAQRYTCGPTGYDTLSECQASCVSPNTCRAITTNTGSSQGVSLQNPIPGSNSIQQLLGKAIKGILGVVGSIALVMFIYGGFVWMTAAGSDQKVSKGKDIILWATIGLIVIFTAYALVNFVFNILGGAASSGG